MCFRFQRWPLRLCFEMTIGICSTTRSRGRNHPHNTPKLEAGQHQACWRRQRRQRGACEEEEDDDDDDDDDNEWLNDDDDDDDNERLNDDDDDDRWVTETDDDDNEWLNDDDDDDDGDDDDINGDDNEGHTDHEDNHNSRTWPPMQHLYDIVSGALRIDLSHNCARDPEKKPANASVGQKIWREPWISSLFEWRNKRWRPCRLRFSGCSYAGLPIFQLRIASMSGQSQTSIFSFGLSLGQRSLHFLSEKVPKLVPSAQRYIHHSTLRKKLQLSPK